MQPSELVQLYTSLAAEYGNGWTPLLEACRQENYDAVYELIQSGADVNAAEKWGRTPLEKAVRYAYRSEDVAAQIVSLLLSSGANINAQNDKGETALMQAAWYNYGVIARILLDNGADVNLRLTDGNTVISSIEEAPSLVRKRKRIIKMMEEAGGVR